MSQEISSSTRKGIKNSLLFSIIGCILLVGFLYGANHDKARLYQEERFVKIEQYRKEVKNMGIPNFNRKEARDYYDKVKKLPELTVDTIHEHVDFGFIAELEGRKLQGYVPMDKGVPLGKSGVTIATGFDIGQRSVQDLVMLELPAALVKKLAPYCGKKKWEAVQFLKDNPLKITSYEADIIDERIQLNKVRGIIDSVGEELWNKMGKGLRTVLASVQFQYGDAKARTPNFYKKALSLDVPAVVNHLRKFGDKYPTRRNKEADYLVRVSGLGNKDTNTMA